jgi:hypothetical protein
MSETPEPHFDAAAQHPSGRRMWGDLLFGATIGLWVLTVFAVVMTPTVFSHLATTTMLTGGGVMSIVCALVCVASACQRQNARNHARLAALVTDQHEQVLRQVRDAVHCMREMTVAVSSISDHMPEALRNQKWQGYAEGAEDLGNRVVSLADFHTGDLRNRMTNHRG